MDYSYVLYGYLVQAGGNEAGLYQEEQIFTSLKDATIYYTELCDNGWLDTKLSNLYIKNDIRKNS